jgi:hypothetical protein
VPYYAGTKYNFKSNTGLRELSIGNASEYRLASTAVKKLDQAIQVLTKKFSKEQLRPFLYDTDG